MVPSSVRPSGLSLLAQMRTASSRQMPVLLLMRWASSLFEEPRTRVATAAELSQDASDRAHELGREQAKAVGVATVLAGKICCRRADPL